MLKGRHQTVTPLQYMNIYLDAWAVGHKRKKYKKLTNKSYIHLQACLQLV